MRNSILEVLVEEKTMANFLKIILPKVLPHYYILEENCFIRIHEGKQHLLKSIPKKIKAYCGYSQEVKVMIVLDQDSENCIKLKSKIESQIDASKIKCLIRIACRELENWYLGDLYAIEKVYNIKARDLINKSKFRDVDVHQGSSLLEDMINGFSKSAASKKIPKFIDIESNRSKSFNVFLDGMKSFFKD